MVEAPCASHALGTPVHIAEVCLDLLKGRLAEVALGLHAPGSQPTEQSSQALFLEQMKGLHVLRQPHVQ